MHTRLKEPDRRGNADRRHRDYRTRTRFSAISRCGPPWGASTVRAGCSCLPHATDYHELIADYEKRPDRSVHESSLVHKKYAPGRLRGEPSRV